MSDRLSLSIGNFDGLHLGHQKLISQTIHHAQTKGLKSAVLCFDPPPRRYFSPHKPHPQLFTVEQKRRALLEAGIEQVIVQEFTEHFATMQAENFVKEYLLKDLKVAHIVVGHDFRFGHNREGDPQTLLQWAKSSGCTVEICNPIVVDQGIVSSSRIRGLLAEGKIKEVHQLLNRAYLLEGRVYSDKKLARQLGFPTLNVRDLEQCLPAFGVYYGRLILGENSPILSMPATSLPAIANCGVRPTLASATASPVLEIHAIDTHLAMDQNYGTTVGFYPLAYLRPERKFNSVDELARQVQQDIEEARHLALAETR